MSAPSPDPELFQIPPDYAVESESVAEPSRTPQSACGHKYPAVAGMTGRSHRFVAM